MLCIEFQNNLNILVVLPKLHMKLECDIRYFSFKLLHLVSFQYKFDFFHLFNRTRFELCEEKERNTACCVYKDGGGCYQSLQESCNVPNLHKHHTNLYSIVWPHRSITIIHIVSSGCVAHLEKLATHIR